MRDRRLHGSYIKELFNGPIQHGAGPSTIWVLMHNKWFEIIPHKNYRKTFDEMMHVCGLFWINDKFVKVGGKSAMVGDSDLVQVSLALVIAHVREA